MFSSNMPDTLIYHQILEMMIFFFLAFFMLYWIEETKKWVERGMTYSKEPQARHEPGQL